MRTSMRNRWIRASLIIIAIIALASIGFRISKSRTFQFFGEIIPRIDTGQKIVALTFDDGPSPGTTDELLAILDEEKTKATFFLIGAELENNPGEARKIVAAGHEVGNHSYSHERMVFKTPAFIHSEIEHTDQLIRQAGYQGTIHFRPPFGKKLFLLPYALSENQRKTIMWDIAPDSSAEIAADSNRIVANVLANAHPGSIILLHAMYPNRRESLKSVRGIVLGLKQQGYSFKTVSEMLATAN
jgi:peptidoglycan-N-acetylglucosamine deacetylase